NVIQYNEYYPFGMQAAASWTRENVTGNNFLANGGTELNPTSTLYDLEFRNYDPVLGRMNQVDPMADKYSSVSAYNFSFNTPIMLNDPRGDDPLDRLYRALVQAIKATQTQGGGGFAPIMDTGTYGGGHITPGSGGNWADGSRYDDWSLWGGSDKFRQGLAAGLTNLGGIFYAVGPKGKLERPQENGGKLGYWMDVFVDWYKKKSDRSSFIDSKYMGSYFKVLAAAG
ncbi:MAG TPA: RHS repeat-associated core domain-containing protein, partial [Cyclobacteriaceae bacterium]|nr:RHS repeat-associated core domain-containing protein [Cyclobacteriaceae bacterium]